MVTTYFLNNVAGNVFRTQTTPGIPAQYFIGLSRTTPALDGTGATEPTGMGYARVLLSNLSTPNGGVVTNNLAISFNESTGNWGIITNFVIFDSLTGGNLLMYDELTTPRSIEPATEVVFKSGNLKLTVSNPV
jgi:hypothetical protein